jgi:hypothetical protein
MNVTDKILNEWSFRCHDGVVDFTDSRKLKVLFEILKPIIGEDIDDDILNALISADPDIKKSVLSFIKKSSSKTAEKTGEDGFYAYLNKHNLTPEYIGGLSDQIFEILSDNDDLDKFNEYRKAPKQLSSLAQTGNIVTILTETGVSQDSVSQILNLVGSEGGRGIGKGEILLALFYGDTKISEGKGDLTSSEGSVEIKGSGARLGDRGTNTSIFSSSDLAKLAIDYEFETVGKGIRIDTLVSYLADEADNADVYKATLDFLRNVFPSIDITQFFPSDAIKSDASMREVLKKIYILNYFTKEGIDRMIYINTSRNAGQYVSFTSDEITEIVNGNLLRIGNFFDYNMNPQLV